MSRMKVWEGKKERKCVFSCEEINEELEDLWEEDGHPVVFQNRDEVTRLMINKPLVDTLSLSPSEM